MGHPAPGTLTYMTRGLCPHACPWQCLFGSCDNQLLCVLHSTMPAPPLSKSINPEPFKTIIIDSFAHMSAPHRKSCKAEGAGHRCTTPFPWSLSTHTAGSSLYLIIVCRQTSCVRRRHAGTSCGAAHDGGVPRLAASARHHAVRGQPAPRRGRADPVSHLPCLWPHPRHPGVTL